jgi:hypothetical protein
MDAGEPESGANFMQDRALPGPSPSANLVGEWKENMITFVSCRLAGSFFDIFANGLGCESAG